ncbi:MAG TPA: tryptophan--tRNA ligase [Candidatus Paceibacterota bacterium]|nr:tryptophan--tRNA ligase [Candidatus Paceibacterota bacterium]
MKHIVVSGIKPSGRLHIGNYLGAMKNYVELQNSGTYQCYFFIADLHAITEPQDPKELTTNIIDVTANFLATGIDPKKSVIFQQSQVAAHAELAWILNTISPLGELERMTQFKDKSAKSAANINMGLFDYPVLMAGDVFLYNAEFIPVGDDQLQHLELARTLARKFNTRFGQTFREPKGLLTQTPRIMSLKDPTKKMSKSEPDGCIFLDDSPELIKKKLARAVTDSDAAIAYDPEKKPGLSNLLEIYGAFTDKDPLAIAIEFEGKQYSDLKTSLADLIADHFKKFREAKKKLIAKPAAIKKVLAAGSKKAGLVATKKMAEVKKKVGF